MAQPTTTAHMEAFADSLFAHSCHTLSSCARPPIPLPCDLGCDSRETSTSAEGESCPCRVAQVYYVASESSWLGPCPAPLSAVSGTP